MWGVPTIRGTIFAEAENKNYGALGSSCLRKASCPVIKNFKA